MKSNNDTNSSITIKHNDTEQKSTKLLYAIFRKKFVNARGEYQRETNRFQANEGIRFPLVVVVVVVFLLNAAITELHNVKRNIVSARNLISAHSTWQKRTAQHKMLVKRQTQKRQQQLLTTNSNNKKNTERHFNK